MANLNVEIKGPIDSKKLWALIERYGVNLTDLGNIVLVYGEVDQKDATDIIAYCGLFGDITSKTGGG